jgi:hypothetical protein
LTISKKTAQLILGPWPGARLLQASDKEKRGSESESPWQGRRHDGARAQAPGPNAWNKVTLTELSELLFFYDLCHSTLALH